MQKYKKMNEYLWNNTKKWTKKCEVDTKKWTNILKSHKKMNEKVWGWYRKMNEYAEIIRLFCIIVKRNLKNIHSACRIDKKQEIDII